VIVVVVTCELCDGCPDQASSIVADDDWKALAESEWNLSPATVTLRVHHPLPSGWRVLGGRIACPRHAATEAQRA
jgi:hypothetical protein